MSIAEVIVVAEDSVYAVMNESGAQWDLQPRVGSVEQMWAGLGDQTLSATSSVLLFSDQVPDTPEALATAVATMAPHALVFVALWDVAGAPALTAAINAAASAQGVDAQFYCVPLRDEKEFLDNVKTVLTSHRPGLVEFPEVWGANIGGHLHPSTPDGTFDADVASPGAPPVDQESLAVTPEPVAAPVAPPVAAPVAPPVAAPVAPPVAAPVAPPVAAPVAPPVAAPVAPPVRPAVEGLSTQRPPVGPPAPAPVAPPVAPVGAPTISAPAAAVSQPVQAVDGPIEGGPLDGYRAPESNTTLTFFSSKGGSGKSTTAMMVATTIALSSKAAGKPLKVVLVDMDTRDGQVASLVGTYAPTALNIRVAEDWDEETILKNLIHSEKLGIDCLLAPIRPRTADDVGPDFYRHVIRTLQHTHDVVIMDCSVNYLDPLISTVCLPEAKAVLFVTTMATTAVQGMARALREITEPVQSGGMGIPRSKIGIVVNQSAQNIGLDKDQVTQAALRVPIVGAIPLSTTDVLKATNSNKMHFLTKHPTLGPAYLRLARVCLPQAALVEIDGTPVPPGEVAAAAVPSAFEAPQQAPVADQGVPVPQAAQEQAAGEDEPKVGRRRLSFSRKG